MAEVATHDVMPCADRSDDRYEQVVGWVGFEDDGGRVVVTASADAAATLAIRHEPFALYRKVET